MNDLKSEEFREFISKGDVVVDFWAPWCGPCKMLGPIFEEISKELTKVKFGKVNVDDAEDVAVESSIRGVPTIILYRDGKEINRIVGFLTKDVLKSQINETFS